MKSEENFIYQTSNQTHPFVFEINNELPIPDYLDESYWWAYLHPNGVKFFDKTWVVNSILFGNYNKLRDNIVNDLDENAGNILQLAAVYGNISAKIAEIVFCLLHDQWHRVECRRLELPLLPKRQQD